MRLRPLLAIACVVLAIALPARSAPPDGKGMLIVSAAVSLSDALEAQRGRIERRIGLPVALNVGGSNSLARQVLAGAPVDVFISADPDQVAMLASAGRIALDTRIALLSNRLVLVTTPDRLATLASPRDLLSPAFRRIAMGDPAGVPAGVYARRYLEREGLWTALQRKVVPGSSVRAALAAIEAGEADAAFVYATDVRTTSRIRVAYAVPAGKAPPILYVAAVALDAPHPEAARACLRLLSEPDSLAAFERYGFERPPAADVPPSSTAARDRQDIDWRSLATIGRFTVAVALAATLLMLPPAIVIAWVLARGRFVGKVLLETLVSLPLVLPPVATGLILLRVLGRRGPFGALLAGGGVDVVFTWKAVVLAMAVMGFPLVVRTARAGFEQVTRRYEQVAETLGAGPARVFFTISLPLAARNVFAGALLGFSRALGEFGATIVVAGSIPGSTRTLSVAIFGYIETGQDAHAMVLLGVSAAIAFAAVWLSNLLVKGQG